MDRFEPYARYKTVFSGFLSSSRFGSESGCWVWCFERRREWYRLGSASIEVGLRASCSLSVEGGGRRGCSGGAVIVIVDQPVVLLIAICTLLKERGVGLDVVAEVGQSGDNWDALIAEQTLRLRMNWTEILYPVKQQRSLEWRALLYIRWGSFMKVSSISELACHDVGC